MQQLPCAMQEQNNTTFRNQRADQTLGPKGVIRETGLQELAQDRKVIAVQGS